MPDILLTLELLIRLAGFGCIFAAMAAWDPRAAPRANAWTHDALARQHWQRRSRYDFGPPAVPDDGHRARSAEARGWGLFHALDLPAWAGALFAVMALDLAIYLQHVLFHAVPVLWR